MAICCPPQPPPPDPQKPSTQKSNSQRLPSVKLISHSFYHRGGSKPLNCLFSLIFQDIHFSPIALSLYQLPVGVHTVMLSPQLPTERLHHLYGGIALGERLREGQCRRLCQHMLACQSASFQDGDPFSR